MPFPTTPILDDFNRANEDPIALPWVSLTGTPTCRIVSNAFALSSGTFGQAYYSTFVAANIECYVTMSTFSGQFLMMFRHNGESDSTKIGYEVICTGALLQLNTHQPSGGVTLASIAYVPASGDKVGARANGNKLEVWLDRVAVPGWTLILEATNDAYRAPGRVSLQWADTTGRADNFGGGVIPQEADNPPIGVLGRGAGW